VKLNLSLGFDVGCGKAGVPSKGSFTAAFENAISAGMGAQKRRMGGKNGLASIEWGLSLQIVEQDAGLALNQRYRQKAYATNVLAFPADALAQKQGWLGDVVICKPVIEQEAIAQNKRLKSHYLHMSVHAGLHLLGFDHLNDADASAMEALEAEVLLGMGIANPYWVI